MDLDEFWRVIAASRESGASSVEELTEALTALLVGRSRDDLIVFGAIFLQQSARAHRDDLWAAGGLIAGHLGDSAFMAFTPWLVSLGRDRFERAIHDPDSLADLPLELSEDVWFEDYESAVLDAWEQTYGGDIPDAPGLHLEVDDPRDRGFPENVAATYPRLAVKYGQRS